MAKHPERDGFGIGPAREVPIIDPSEAKHGASRSIT
jgi:hypothetical protein